jgi:creatinine amidohydrolase
MSSSKSDSEVKRFAAIVILRWMNPTNSSASPRPYVLWEANYKQLQDYKPNVAILPWGATEAHNYHLPHATDVIEATEIATRAAKLAFEREAKPIVLPAIPFGNDEQQLDQISTISITTRTAAAIMRDVVRSLARQGVDRLIILNAHGGNEFKPLIRDLQGEFSTLVVLVNFYQIAKYEPDPRAAHPGDHADEMETSLMLHLAPNLVQLDQAGDGRRVPFAIEGLNQPGVWTPRPWSQSHPDSGSGDPKFATAEKGRQHFEKITESIAQVIVNLSKAVKGQIPYL